MKSSRTSSSKVSSPFTSMTSSSSHQHWKNIALSPAWSWNSCESISCTSDTRKDSHQIPWCYHLAQQGQNGPSEDSWCVGVAYPYQQKGGPVLRWFHQLLLKIHPKLLATCLPLV